MIDSERHGSPAADDCLPLPESAIAIRLIAATTDLVAFGDPCLVSRVEYWEQNPWRLPATHRHEDDDDPLEHAWQERVTNPKRPRESSSGHTTTNLMRSAKEVIYCRDEEGRGTFQYVTWGLDFGSAEFTVHVTWLLAEPTRDDLLRTIGFALALRVPVVPDTDELSAELAALEREVLARGFPVEDHDRTRHLIPSKYADLDVDAVEALDVLSRAEPIMPSETRVLLATARRELDARAEAGRVLKALRLGISELGEALQTDHRNEGALQSCLTRHPILFGPEYRRLIPKFRLGGDFELDFALQRAGGLVDLVEIEASTHAVFNRRGDPSAALVHAEQQILDWLNWLDRYGELPRRDLPEIQRPTGYVVIGRDLKWDDTAHRRLQQRNQVLGGALQVLTWDGLVRRASTLLSHLEGLSEAGTSG